MKDQKILIPALIAVTAVLILSFLIKNHHDHCLICINLKTFTPAVIKHYVLSFGPWALVVFIGLYAVNTISILPPIGIMSLTAGFIFGSLKGIFALMTGAFLGTTATFFISRFFGAQLVEKIISGKAKEFQEKLNQNGFQVILVMRLIPFFPWEIINYAAGLSRITYRDYILGTMIGVIPSIVIQSFFSDRISNFNLKDPGLIVAVAAYVLLCTVPVIYLKRKKKMEMAKNESGKQF